METNMEINVSEVIFSCLKLRNRARCMDGTNIDCVSMFNDCMKVFNAQLPAEAITFAIFIDKPVSMPGTATIHRDGKLEMRISNVVIK